MRQCKQCGALLNNHHNFCIDCGERLGSPLSKEDEARMNAAVTDRIESLSNKGDYFFVRKIDKLKAAALILCAILYIPVLILEGRAMDTRLLLIGFVFTIALLASSLDILYPRLSWELYKLKFILTIAAPDDLQPSELSLIMKRLFANIYLLLGYGFLLFLIMNYI